MSRQCKLPKFYSIFDIVIFYVNFGRNIKYYVDQLQGNFLMAHLVNRLKNRFTI